MLVEFQAAFAAVKSGLEMIKSIQDIKQSNQIQANELNNIIIELQTKLIAVNSALMTAENRYMQLEKEMNNLRYCASQFEQYVLYPLPTGAFTYRYQRQENDPTPTHDICTNCKEKNIKSILQTVSPNHLTEYLYCPTCHKQIVTKSPVLQAKARKNAEI